MYAIIPQDYDTTTDACQVHLVVCCDRVEKRPVGESIRVWYTQSGKAKSELVDPVIGVYTNRRAAELAAASRTANSAYRFSGERNRDALEAAEELDERYPVGPERTAIFAE